MPSASDLRSGVSELSALAAADLEALWRQLTSADEAREALQDVLPALVDTYGAASATLAADWYDELRDEVGVGGRFFAIPAEVTDSGADVLARWGIGPLFAEEPDWARAQVLIAGGLQLRIANASRQTVTRSAIADPGAAGWQRVGDGSSCPFCAMLIGRGAVYSKEGVDFGAHDNCGCQAMPAWADRPVPVKPYVPTERRVNAKDRARARRWMRDHGLT